MRKEIIGGVDLADIFMTPLPLVLTPAAAPPLQPTISLSNEQFVVVFLCNTQHMFTSGIP